MLSSKTETPIFVSGPKFDKPEQNVILWLDHRPVAEAEMINAINDPVLKYVGGQMGVDMEIISIACEISMYRYSCYISPTRYPAHPAHL